MKGIFVDTNFFKENKDGINRLQSALIAVATKSIRDRIDDEITFCFKEKRISHWMMSVLPDRIAMLLRRPFDDRLLRESGKEELRERVNAALYNETVCAPMILHFGILERRFLLKRVRNTDSKKNEERAMMVFYESHPELPDERLQKIAIEIFKKYGIPTLVK